MRTKQTVSALCLALLGVLAAPALAMGVRARTADPPQATPLACGYQQLQTAAQAGGSYVFTANCSITLPQQLVVTSTLSLSSGGYSVTLANPAPAFGVTGVNRALDIEAPGNVNLSGINLHGEVQEAGTDGAAGSTGAPGGAGTAPAGPALAGAVYLAPGTSLTTNGGTIGGNVVSQGGDGGAGGDNSGVGNAAGDGGPAAAASTAEGGVFYVSSGAQLTVTGTAISGGTAISNAGVGGPGGEAGGGQTWGNGGLGGDAGPAEGGAIYNAGSTSLSNVTFLGTYVQSSGDSGGDVLANNAAPQVGSGGNGGNGGNGADALGGAIYNSGTLTLQQVTFNGDKAYSDGGGGGAVNEGGTPGNGGNAGTAEGGALYTTTSVPQGCATFTSDAVTAVAGAGGADEISPYTPGTSGNGGTTGGTDLFAVAGATVGNCQPPSLSVSDAFVQEPVGSGNIAYANFTVTLSQAPQSNVTVNYGTVDGTAGNGYGAATVAHGDYGQTSGTLTFTPSGSLSQPVTVPVYASGLTQPSRFSVQLSGATGGATISKSIGIGTITVCGNPGASTTGCALVQVSDPTVTEPAFPGQTKAAFTIQLSQAPQTAVAVQYTTQDGTATAPANYAKTTGTANFAVGQTSATVNVPVNAVSTPHEPVQFQLVATRATGGAEIIPPYNAATATIYSPYVTFSTQRSHQIFSSQNPSLIQAGTTFAIQVTMHNYRPERVQVDWLYPILSGNATDGRMVPDTETVPSGPATGALSEASANQYVVLSPPNPSNPAGTLAPGEKQTFNILVRTTASDAFSDLQPSPGFPDGGTRATVTLPQPNVSTLDQSNNATPLDASYLQLSGWDPINVGIDDSAPQPPPKTVGAVVGNFAGDVLDGLWDITVGAVQGVWQLASSTVPSAGSWALQQDKEYLDYLASLWQATNNDPAAKAAFFSTLESQVVSALQDVPWVLQQQGSSLYSSIHDSVYAWEEKFLKDWESGQWQAAQDDIVKPTTELVGSIALPTVAEALAPSVLARLPEAADAFKAATADMIGEVSDRLNSLIQGVTSAAEGIKALDAVPAGYQFTIRQLENLAGLTKQQVQGLIEFCTPSGNPTGRGLVITLRSRAAQAVKYIADGVAAMKPEAIKMKTINFFDQYLGFRQDDIGKVMFRFKLPGLEDYENTLRAAGVREGTDQWTGAIANYKQRLYEISNHHDGYAHQLLEWNKQGSIRLRWNWRDNGINPLLKTNEYQTYKFRLCPRGNCLVTPKDIELAIASGEPLTPEVYAGGRWRFFTGDVDLTSITYENGEALSDADLIAVLGSKFMRTVLDIQHPAAATWYGPDGEFWFALKEKYLSNGGKPQVQFAPDGKVRSVVFNQDINSLLSAFDFFQDKNNFFIYWNGGFQQL